MTPGISCVKNSGRARVFGHNAPVRPASVVATLALAGLLTGSAGPLAVVRQAPPGDCEVRVTRDSFTNDTITTLTLMLQAPKGKPLPVSLVLTAVRRYRAKASDPLAMHMDFYLPLYVGRLEPKPPHLVFVLDRNTKDEHTDSFSVPPSVPIGPGGVDYVSLPFDAAALARLAKAGTIDGRVLGIVFELTAKQVTAIHGFPARLTK